MHNELGNSLPSFIQAYKNILSGTDMDKVIRTTQNLDQIQYIQNQFDELRYDVQKLCRLQFSLTGDVSEKPNHFVTNYFDSLSYQYKVLNARRQVIKLKL